MFCRSHFSKVHDVMTAYLINRAKKIDELADKPEELQKYLEYESFLT